MEKHTIVLKLDPGIVAKLDQEVIESNGKYASRAHLLRQLIANRYQSPPQSTTNQIPPPAPSVLDALARAEADLRGETGWETGTDSAEVS